MSEQPFRAAAPPKNPEPARPRTVPLLPVLAMSLVIGAIGGLVLTTLFAATRGDAFRDPLVAGAAVSRIEMPAVETQNAIELTKLVPTATSSPTPTATAIPPTPQPTPDDLARYGLCRPGTQVPGSICVPSKPVTVATAIPVCVTPFTSSRACQWPGETQDTKARQVTE